MVVCEYVIDNKIIISILVHISRWIVEKKTHDNHKIVKKYHWVYLSPEMFLETLKFIRISTSENILQWNGVAYVLKGLVLLLSTIYKHWGFAVEIHKFLKLKHSHYYQCLTCPSFILFLLLFIITFTSLFHNCLSSIDKK